MEEVWKDIKDYEDEYEVSNLGRVRSLDRWVDGKNGSKQLRKGKILKPRLNYNGYFRVVLCKNESQKTKSIHRLVWETFNGEIPKGLQVNHINEDKTDNRLDNLNLMTCKDNNNWGTRNERISKANRLVQRNNKKKSKSVIQKTLQGEIIKVWPSTKEIERQLGYANQNISKCCRGGCYKKGKWVNIKQMYGFIWQYTDKAAS